MTSTPMSVVLKSQTGTRLAPLCAETIVRAVTVSTMLACLSTIICWIAP
jgi:hypothetical protein